MITYTVKAILAAKSEDGDIEFRESIIPFVDSENPIDARKNAYDRYVSFLAVIGDPDDPENNLWKHISQYSEGETFQHGKFKYQIPTNKEGMGVNLFFILDEDFMAIKKNEENLIVGDQEVRAYLTLAENLVAEMNYYKTNGYHTDNYTSNIRFWNYESNKENEEVIEKVLFTPYDFWANWNPKLAEGDL